MAIPTLRSASRPAALAVQALGEKGGAEFDAVAAAKEPGPYMAGLDEAVCVALIAS